MIAWLNDPACALEPGGRIGFCVSAVMESALAAAIHEVKEEAGSIEHTHDEIKNALRGTHMPKYQAGHPRTLLRPHGPLL